MIHLALAPFLLVGAGDPVVELRVDLQTSDGKQAVVAYQPAGTFEDALGVPVATDLKFEKAAGNKPTRFVFPADWDGDGSDEIVTVRRETSKKLGPDLRVRIYEPPVTIDANAKLSASSTKATLGTDDGDGAILQVGALDLDGDGKDEAFVIRQWSDGSQSLEIRRFPSGKNKKVKKPIASDPTFGEANVDGNRAACGADVDGDGKHELVVIRRGLTGPDRLLVFTPPTTVDGETGDPIRSDEDITPSDGGTNVHLARMDRDGDGKDELALIRQATLGPKRLEVVGPPPGVATELGAIEFLEPNLVVSGDPHDVRAVFGLRGYTAVPPKPPADLSGQYVATFMHEVLGTPEQVHPSGTLTAIMSGTNTFSIMLPTFNVLNGTYSQADATIDFDAFGTVFKLDDLATGNKYWLDFSAGSVTVNEGTLTISGTYVGTKDPPIGPNEPVAFGTFTFVRN